MKYIFQIILIIISCSWVSCVEVRAYQKMYINDRDMQANSPINQFDDFLNYREGASGGIDQENTGGGCGCN